MSPRARALTPPGAGGVAVIEVCGAGARARVRALAGGRPLPPTVPVLARLAVGEEILDEALVVDLGAGAGAGERVEVHVHGSPPLVERLVELLDAPGGATEDAGLAERALARLADAPCEAAARILLDQAEGALAGELADLARERDEERFHARLDALLARSARARRALEPPTVVLAGQVNAGKSTLFNVLAGRRRVVVSAEPGTTRDAVAELVLLGEWPIRLVDTAGERALCVDASAAPAAALVERAGQELARAEREAADVVLWLVPPQADAAPEEVPLRATIEPRTRARRDEGHLAAPAGTRPAPRWIVVLSQADRAPVVRGADRPRISALERPDEARATVAELVRVALDLPREPWERGAAVAFEPALVHALERAARAGSQTERAVLLRRIAGVEAAGGIG